MASAAVLWAIGGTVARSLIDAGASVVELTEARAWVAVVVLAVVARVGRRPSGTASWWLVALFGLAIAAVNVTYYAAVALLPVAVAITIEYAAPALVVLWTVATERWRPRPMMVVAIGSALVGVAFLAEVPVLIDEGRLRLSGAGLLAAVASAVAFATYMVVGERLSRTLSSREAVFRGFAVASLLWVIVQMFRGRPDTLLEPRFLGGILFLGVGTTVVPFLLFVWGLGRIRATEAGVTSTLEPLTAAVIGFVWLGQRLSGWQVVGGLLVLAGVTVVQVLRPTDEHVLAERAAVE